MSGYPPAEAENAAQARGSGHASAPATVEHNLTKSRYSTPWGPPLGWVTLRAALRWGGSIIERRGVAVPAATPRRQTGSYPHIHRGLHPLPRNPLPLFPPPLLHSFRTAWVGQNPIGVLAHFSSGARSFAGDRVSGPRRDSLADELAAFANSRGGVFVFGVHGRTRDVVGIAAERLDAVVDFIKEVCAASVDPPIENFALDRLRLLTGTGEDVAVIKAEIPRSLFIHRSPGGFLHRVADSKRPMSTEYLARIFQQRSQTGLIGSDQQTVEGASIENLTPDLLDRFRTPRSYDDRDTFSASWDSRARRKSERCGPRSPAC